MGEDVGGRHASPYAFHACSITHSAATFFLERVVLARGLALLDKMNLACIW